MSYRGDLKSVFDEADRLKNNKVFNSEKQLLMSRTKEPEIPVSFGATTFRTTALDIKTSNKITLIPSIGNDIYQKNAICKFNLRKQTFSLSSYA